MNEIVPVVTPVEEIERQVQGEHPHKPLEWLLHDADGIIRRRVSCNRAHIEENTPEGLTAVLVAPGTSHRGVKFENGELVPHEPEVQPVHWSDARKLAFTSAWDVASQLEAFHDALNGRPDKLAAMNADFDQIRSTIPKPKSAD